MVTRLCRDGCTRPSRLCRLSPTRGEILNQDDSPSLAGASSSTINWNSSHFLMRSNSDRLIVGGAFTVTRRLPSGVSNKTAAGGSFATTIGVSTVGVGCKAAGTDCAGPSSVPPFFTLNMLCTNHVNNFAGNASGPSEIPPFPTKSYRIGIHPNTIQSRLTRSNSCRLCGDEFTTCGENSTN